LLRDEVEHEDDIASWHPGQPLVTASGVTAAASGNYLLVSRPDDEHATSVLAAIAEAPGYPCLGARSVFHRHRATVRVVGPLGTPRSAARLLRHLQGFAEDTDPSGGLASFVAVFNGPEIESESQFEVLLWKTLQHLHDADTAPWSPAVSHDPAADDFAFSVAGAPYFVIGLNPKASRLARRVPFPALVFNLHAQFDALRAAGRYTRMRDTIRARDAKLQGTINPMACDHGRASSAAQYSGRAVGAHWRAPFEFHDREAEAA
jgi:FPC/CPF motif-containing protein YcgG